MEFIQYILLVIINILAIILTSYFTEKGKNYATKEDVGEITKKVEEVKNNFSKELEIFRNEYLIARTTYDKFIDKILSYYSNIYWFYQLCQELGHHVIAKCPDGTVKNSRDEYINNLDTFVDKYLDYRGYIRLLLPEKLLKADIDLLQAFNDFRDQVLDEEFNPKEETNKFKEIHKKKELLENLLREFLRTERMLH